MCDELPLLKQKIGWLYQNFSQLIFYDLCIEGMCHSSDGSYEFLKNYPDPEKKITIVEKMNLDDVEANNGGSRVQKQKMFRYGSSLVRDDIDVFWCSDADEFCDTAFIDDVEDILLNNPDVMSVDMHHYYFWRDKDIVLEHKGRPGEGMTLFPRVCRHSPGRVYPHCHIANMGPRHMISPDKRKWYHFAWVGDSRAKAKFAHQPVSERGFDDWFNTTWKNLDTSDADSTPRGNPIHFVHGDLGYVKFDGKLPSYINADQLWEDLDNER
tara:strand:+ start:3709 stop:4512 length:804 start_codon:yes stop_codon:yes gene_type:complete